jgi:sugar-specific transcriptional regulator TrmB
LAFLQKQLKEKEEYLQYLKNLVQQMSSSNTENIIVQQKKEEISKIKESIEELNFEISKCKMKE